MTQGQLPFHRFQGWKILALIGVTTVYSVWYSVFGPYAALSALAPGLPLESQLYYDGEYAVSILSQLDAAGQRAKLISLLFDVPYMILNALVFEALIAFGIRRWSLNRPIWSLLFALPIAFLLIDFAEDSFLALTLVSGSTTLGAMAGIFTSVKFLTFSLAALAALIMGGSGLVYWLIKGRKAGNP